MLYTLVLTLILAACSTKHNGRALELKVTSETAFGVQNKNIFTSPYNWRKGAGFIETNSTGGYLKLGFTGSYIKARFDTSSYDALKTVSSNYPRIRVTVDGRSRDVRLTRGSPLITLASGLSSGKHVLKLGFVSTSVARDRWNKPANVVRVTSFRVSSRAYTFKPQVEAKRMVIFADSHGEGNRINSSSSKPDSNDAGKAFGALVAGDFSAELGNIAFSGQGWVVRGGGNVPGAYDLSQNTKGWEQYSARNARMFGEPAPDYVLMIHGHNDHSRGVSDATVSASASAWLSDMRGAAPNADIFLVIPFKGFKREALTVAYTNYKNDHPGDTRTHLLDLGEEAEAIVANNTNDGGNHMNATGHVMMAELLARAMRAQLDVGNSERTPLQGDHTTMLVRGR